MCRSYNLVGHILLGFIKIRKTYHFTLTHLTRKTELRIMNPRYYELNFEMFRLKTENMEILKSSKKVDNSDWRSDS